LDVLTAWSNFYVITGSSAAALTGLMFVVVTLIAGDRPRPTREGFATFSTPSVLHFCAALLASATLSAPWHSLIEPAVILGVGALYGILYALVIIYKTRRQSLYEPDFSDWSWYAVLPLLAYVAMLTSSVLLPALKTGALFGLAAAVMLLIFIGIHNAWDVVTYITIFRDVEAEEEEQSRR
jgi:hypothetical protein